MKKFYYLISFLLCLSGAVMISCGDDDDDVTTGGGGSSSGGSGGSTKTQVINGHEYVDLGLSVLWAKSNIGAHESISGEYSRMNEKNDQGSFFAWGETVEKENFTWGNYKYCTGSDWSTCQYLGDVLPADKDVVQKEWGGGWRMPTYEEAKELVSKCTIKAYAPTIVGSEETMPTSRLKVLTATSSIFPRCSFIPITKRLARQTLTVTMLLRFGLRRIIVRYSTLKVILLWNEQRPCSWDITSMMPPTMCMVLLLIPEGRAILYVP